jgi:hypothetical protein
VASSIVLIGPADAIPSLRERLDSGAELHAFTDAEALEALDHVIRNKPRIVALDHEFSTTSRGTAFINRIKDDPTLGQCEVRVIAHDAAVNRVSNVRRGPSVTTAAIAVDEPKSELDKAGTRRAPRVAIRDGVECTIDGNPAAVIDVSLVGAQVISSKQLKPNQRVRVVFAFADQKAVIRCNGAIAWASFEMPKGMATRYRAGIELTGVDTDALGRYADTYKKA